MLRISTLQKKRLILLAFAIVFFFGILEISVRLFWEEESPTRYGYPPHLIIPDASRGYKYQPLFSGSFQGPLYRDITITINSHGLRDEEHNYTKPPRTLRILVLGDSTTFGPGVRYEDTLFARLEQSLRRNGYSVEIIKAGFSGYEFEQEYTYYIEEGYHYTPNIVMIGVTPNDLQPVNLTEVSRMMFPQPPSGFRAHLRRFLRNHVKSLLWTYQSLKTIRKLTPEEYNLAYFTKIYRLWENKTANTYDEKLLDLYQRLQQENKTLVLILFPYTHQFTHGLNYGRLPQENIFNLSQGSNMIVIDLLPSLDVPEFSTFYLPNDNVHLNAQGYKKAADTTLLALLQTPAITQKLPSLENTTS